MMIFGWKKRCRQLEAENAQLKEHIAQLETRLTEAQAKNKQLIQALAAAPKNYWTWCFRAKDFIVFKSFRETERLRSPSHR